MALLSLQVQAEFKKKWYRYMLKRQGSGFSRRHTVTSYVSRASVANQNCIDTDGVNGNGHCVIDNNSMIEKNVIYLKKPHLNSDQHTVVNDYTMNELCPMVNSTEESHQPRDSISDPMLPKRVNHCHDIT